MRFCLFLLLSFLFSSLHSGNRPKEKALEIADRFFRTNSATSRSTTFQYVELEDGAFDKSPTFYVFNNTHDTGFVIVSGDDRTPPILGYSFENHFPQTNLPCNVKMWMNDIDAQITHLYKNNILSPDNDNEIGEEKIMLNTPLWGQGEPYNNQCPTFNGEKTPSGCVMTAMAIVMKHHQWPEKGFGVIPGYTTRSYRHSFPEHELRHTYDWENMPYQYDTYTQNQANNVATLMFDLGMMMEADYVPNGTGAYISDIPSAMQTYMNYDAAIDELYRNDYSDSEWNQLLKNELDNNRPIIYGGFDKAMSGGHAFVLEGYTTNNYYSINWGWDGVYNGYFLLSALEPTGQGTGGNNSNFNYNQSAVIGIKKNENITERLEFVARQDGLNGFMSSTEFFSVNVPFSISAGVIKNTGISKFEGSLMLGLTNSNGKLKEELVSYEITCLDIEKGYTFENIECVITKTIHKGDRIRAFYKSEQTREWTIIKGDENCNDEILVADEYTIDESTNIIYNKEKKCLDIETKKGVRVEFLKESGDDLSSLCNSSHKGVEIFVDDLERGTYVIKLSKGDESRSLKIILGNKKTE